MSTATIHFNGLMAPGRDNNCTISFEEPQINVEMFLTLIKAEVPAKTVAFVAINGKKAGPGSLIKDGDCVDVFPAVAGG